MARKKPPQQEHIPIEIVAAHYDKLWQYLNANLDLQLQRAKVNDVDLTLKSQIVDHIYSKFLENKYMESKLYNGSMNHKDLELYTIPALKQIIENPAGELSEFKLNFDTNIPHINAHIKEEQIKAEEKITSQKPTQRQKLNTLMNQGKFATKKALQTAVIANLAPIAASVYLARKSNSKKQSIKKIRSDSSIKNNPSSKHKPRGKGVNK